jgi:hypothetical protein
MSNYISAETHYNEERIVKLVIGLDEGDAMLFANFLKDGRDRMARNMEKVQEKKTAEEIRLAQRYKATDRLLEDILEELKTVIG